jgi:hypothetical protein
MLMNKFRYLSVIYFILIKFIQYNTLHYPHNKPFAAFRG